VITDGQFSVVTNSLSVAVKMMSGFYGREDLERTSYTATLPWQISNRDRLSLTHHAELLGRDAPSV